MSVGMETTEFKSPVRKLVSFFHLSRDRWKAKHHQVKQDLRKALNQAAAVEKSRERWRVETLELRRQVRTLERQLAEQKPSRP